MNIILLSGGSGKRLWPLSNDIRSKQFIKLLKRDGIYESMIQRVYRQICSVVPEAKINIAASKKQASMICSQIGDNVNICVEPSRKDTFPAIALACSYLHDVKGILSEEVVIVCPVDPYVEQGYFQALEELESLVAQSDDTNLTLMGVVPTYPSEKYGYIIPKTDKAVSKVDAFKEKPDVKTAQAYIEKGALWNSGVFAFKLSYILEKAHQLIDFLDYEDLYEKYNTLEKISFDYAVVEQETHIQVLRFCGTWKDLGTWNTLTEEISETAIGKAMYDEACSNTHIINELNIPILCMGLKDVIVSASADGILVSNKGQSSHIKPFVDTIEQEIMFAEKSWGSYTVLDVQEESMTIRVVLNQGRRMNYHSHEYRDEVWTIISGAGKTIVDGMEKSVRAGDVIAMHAGCRHTIMADTELKLIEIQLGKEISVKDKQKYELDR
ncbi:cupin domain-containing protein [Lachnospiraceae bacterium ZAX-1]